MTPINAAMIGEVLDHPDDNVALVICKMGAEAVLAHLLERSVRDYSGLQTVVVDFAGRAQLAYSIGCIDAEIFAWMKRVMGLTSFQDIVDERAVSMRCNDVDMARFPFRDQIKPAVRIRAALAMALWTIGEYASMDIRQSVDFEE